ncbi:MAG: ADP-heptose synthase [Alphaproteobacteria bacterium HGW-Alphaproteobacteria-5]|nr:MAG: ADP-heptose synthase [Alphaproteobacteria bacterium HGW-Alphaproteobacteria-5]
MSDRMKDPIEHMRAGFGPKTTIVFVSGIFNVLHTGHVRLLRFAREMGSVLVVGVLPDSSEGVSAPAELRLEGVLSNKSVSHAFLITGPVEEVIDALRPDIVVKGKEHEARTNAERAALARYGGKLIFSSGEMMQSSLSSLDEADEIQGAAHDILPRDYMRRHDITVRELCDLTRAVERVKVIVVGDIIIDEYIDCDPLGMSQEDPTIVVTPIGERRFLGGAGIVAAHARGLGADVTFFGVVGKDDAGGYAREKFSEYGVGSVLLEDESRPTTVKQRFRAAGKTLLRVSRLRQHSISEELSARLLAEIEPRLDGTTLILFSDFNYGSLPTPFVTRLSELASARGVMMAADSQASSQLSDIGRFRGMRLITPTELEARMALKDQTSSLVVISETLHSAASATNVIVTLGRDGLLIRAEHEGRLMTDRLPALNRVPKDVAGAGDSLFCLTSLALAADGDIWRASLLGAVVAACQVARIGNMPLTRDAVLGTLSVANGDGS